MSKKKSVKRRRGLKKHTVVAFEQRDFPKEIIKRLEAVAAISGRRPGEIFSDWVFITEATLKALPEQVKAVGATGHFAEDASEVTDTFARVRAHYDPKYLGEERAHQVWHNFAEAFALLLEATAPGLWGEPNSLGVAGISGPDILGHIFQTWASPPSGKTWHGQVLTPWNVASMMAQMLNIDVERMAYDRVKEALCHPDNVFGAAVLLASLVIPENEPGAHFDWFLNRCFPAAAPYLKPISVNEPAVGTGVMILAHAAASPEWAVRNYIIRYFAQDIDPLMVACTRSSLQLYGINGYSLQLEAAVLEALRARQQDSENGQVLSASSPAQVIRDVYRNGHSSVRTEGSQSSFEKMFRAVARHQPAAAEAPQD